MSQTQQIVLETLVSNTEPSQPAVSHLEETAASEQAAQTFDAVSPTVPEKTRRLAIIILIVSSNMVQVSTRSVASILITFLQKSR